MKTSVATTVTIDATSSEVFEYLSNLKYHYLWNPQLIDISSRKKLRLNATYSTTSNVLGITIQTKNIVTRFEPDKLLQLENDTGMIHYVARFTLAPKDGKTLVKCSTTVSTESPAFGFAQPVLKLLARRELQTDLQALKLACENKLLQ